MECIKDKEAKYIAVTNQEMGELNWTILSGKIGTIIDCLSPVCIRTIDGQKIFKLCGADIKAIFFFDEELRVMAIYDAALDGFRNHSSESSRRDISRILFADNEIHRPDLNTEAGIAQLRIMKYNVNELEKTLKDEK